MIAEVSVLLRFMFDGDGVCSSCSEWTKDLSTVQVEMDDNMHELVDEDSGYPIRLCSICSRRLIKERGRPRDMRNFLNSGGGQHG